jgi:hypothetical protein
VLKVLSHAVAFAIGGLVAVIAAGVYIVSEGGKAVSGR